MVNNRMKFGVLAVLMVTTGFATLSLAGAQAESVIGPNGAEDYAAARINAAFVVVDGIPPANVVIVPMAERGDLPVPPGCMGMTGDLQSECMDVAYEGTVPSVVIETRFGTTSTLLRLDPMTVAGIEEEATQQSE